MERECEEADVVMKSRGRYAEKYTQEGLHEAIERIRNNEMSYGAASRMYNIPKATLHHKIKNPENCPRGATTILSKEQEDEVAEWVLLHADFGDPRTKQDIIIAAAEIAQLDDTSVKFKNGIPTSGWLEGFLSRHPLCRERTPQSISKASAINTKEDFSGLWRNIYNYFEKTNQLDLLYKPECWWNADETCFEKDKVPKKVIARRGANRVSRREMGPPKANTTVTYAFAANGDYVEPLITLKDSNSSVAEIAFALGSVGANYGINQTESGWTKTESFYYFVTIHLHNQWEAKNSAKPRILTIDGYGAHFSPKLFRWCRRHDVIMIVLYPGATPYMQMCDTTMFSPMKQKHTQLYSQWRLKNPTKSMNDVEFVKILKQINDAVIKKESIVNGWRATGLQPFNFNNLNTAGLLSKSPDRMYDFKGFYVDPPSESNQTAVVEQPKVNVLSDVILNPTSENYIHFNSLSSTLHPRFGAPISKPLTQDGFILPISNQVHSDFIPQIGNQVQFDFFSHNGNQVQPKFISINGNQVQRDVISLNGNQVERDVHSSVVVNDVVELLDVNMEDIPEGPVQSESGFQNPFAWNVTGGSTMYSREYQDQTAKKHQEAATPSGQVRINDFVTFGELSGQNEVFKSQSEAKFDLGTFGISSGEPQPENESKMGKVVDRIRRDVRQLGLLCAASDKSKLINVLIINQQLDAIDLPAVEELEPEIQEKRTIKSILKPPTMPQRAKPKRNLNLKVAYGVVTAKEVVQNIIDREAADRQHELEREQDDIAKIARESEIAVVDAELKSMRKLLAAARSEVAALCKEMTLAKKNKTARKLDCEAEKVEKDDLVKKYDEQVRESREKLKHLKAAHVEINKTVSMKRKNFDLTKKEIGNKVHPTTTPSEIDDMELDSDAQ